MFAVAVVVLLCVQTISAQEAQVNQTENRTISVTYPARALAEGDEACPTGEQHDTLLSVTDKEVESILKEIVDVVAPCNETYLGLTERCPAKNCNEIFLSSRVWRPSGIYWLNTSDGTPIEVYCHMTRDQCCDTIGGWYRAAWLNMSDPNQDCPSGWRSESNPSYRSCGRNLNDLIETVTFSSRGMVYSRVCGRVNAYQQGGPEAFWSSHSNPATNINQTYVDGVSITYGSSRKHIWTFAAARTDQLGYHTATICPCTNTASNVQINIPSFVGNDYFCEAGTNFQPSSSNIFSNDLLWDGQGCPISSTCCMFNNPPWFCKVLPSPTNENIEVRVMSDEIYTNEDVLIRLIEIYIQ